MEPRTISLLYDNIDDDYRWRIIELSNFRTAVLSQSNSKTTNALVRAGVSLLYSHWEGFVKHTSDQYYKYVTFQNLKTGQLSDSFISILLRKEIEELASSKKIKLHSRVIQMFIDEMSKEAKFSATSPIKTSNLNYSIFEDICEMVGVDLDEFEKIYHKKGFDRNPKLTIDEDLVYKRNNIAHGQRMLVELKEFKLLYDVVVNGFLTVFKELIMDAAQSHNYKRTNPMA